MNSKFCRPALSYEEYEDDETVIICWKPDEVTDAWEFVKVMGKE